MSKKNQEVENAENEDQREELNEQKQAESEHTEENVENNSESTDHEEEIKALNDKYLRLYSEFDNFRRRTQKEKIELYKTAGEDIFKSLIPIMDDFERAKKSMEETQDYQSLKEGVDLIFNKFLSVFKSNGLEPMESPIGKDFDSELHEAVTQIPAPEEKLKGKVVDEIEKGYILKEKVIRYAKVVVGQ